jgi:hypothetical protein
MDSDLLGSYHNYKCWVRIIEKKSFFSRIFLFRYGDISPITPIGRVIACLCALFGAATIGMLVSVLVDRYQRVFARKLYINEDVIDFDEYSDDENTDGDSRGSSGQIRRRANTKEIEDPDARAKVNAAFERENTTTTTDVTDVLPKPDIQTGIETPTNQCNNRVHFIFGYVNDENHEPSSDVIETISSVIAQKQSEGDNIQLNVMSDEQQRSSSPYKVKFHISTPSDDDSDEDEELTEIVSGCGIKVKKKSNLFLNKSIMFSVSSKLIL